MWPDQEKVDPVCPEPGATEGAVSEPSRTPALRRRSVVVTGSRWSPKRPGHEPRCPGPQALSEAHGGGSGGKRSTGAEEARAGMRVRTPALHWKPLFPRPRRGAGFDPGAPASIRSKAK